jgi:hypothetical protein
MLPIVNIIYCHIMVVFISYWELKTSNEKSVEHKHIFRVNYETAESFCRLLAYYVTGNLVKHIVS